MCSSLLQPHHLFLSTEKAPNSWTVTCQAPASMGFFEAKTLKCVAVSFSRGSSQPRDWTLVSCIAGRLFIIWATRGAWSRRWPKQIQVFWLGAQPFLHCPSCPYIWELWSATLSAVYLVKQFFFLKFCLCSASKENHDTGTLGKLRLRPICCCCQSNSCPTLCDPMDCSTPGSSVLYDLPELAQIHVHWVSDAIWPSHPLLPPSPILSSIRVFYNELVLHIRWPKYRSFSFSISPSNEYSGLISFRTDWPISGLWSQQHLGKLHRIY